MRARGSRPRARFAFVGEPFDARCGGRMLSPARRSRIPARVQIRHPFPVRRSPMAKLSINGKQYDVAVPGDTPLLWVLRDELGLTGTKFGCGMALCGACTIHIDGQPGRACVTPISSLAGRKVV